MSSSDPISINDRTGYIVVRLVEDYKFEISELSGAPILYFNLEEAEKMILTLSQFVQTTKNIISLDKERQNLKENIGTIPSPNFQVSTIKNSSSPFTAPPQASVPRKTPLQIVNMPADLNEEELELCINALHHKAKLNQMVIVPEPLVSQLLLEGFKGKRTTISQMMTELEAVNIKCNRNHVKDVLDNYRKDNTIA